MKSLHDWDFLSHNYPLSLTPLGRPDIMFRLPHRTMLRCGEKMAKKGVKGVKGHKKSQWAKRVEQWTGAEEGPVSPDVWSARFACRYFFALFSATAELGPRLECLTKSLKTSARESNVHRKNSSNKSKNGTRVVKRVTTMFILVFLVTFPSNPVAIRINTISN